MDASSPATPPNPRVYGHIPGVPVGAKFANRKKVLLAGVHGQIRAGIHGDPNEGAFSICIAGGYEDNKDFGDKIIYVGSGGQDLKTKEQNEDQSFDYPPNLSLLVSFLKRRPVRVIRGEDGPSLYAPLSGYRYDGLYLVDSASMKEGKSKYNMCFFELNRIRKEGDGPLPKRF